MFVLLSHTMTLDDPNWPGAPGLTMRPLHQIARGDVANTHVVELYDHYGTHVDGPYHFNPEGARLSDLAIGDFIFERPVVLDVAVGDGELVAPEHLPPALVDPATDLLILRSGFERHRPDRTRYVDGGPGFTAAAAVHLRESFQNLRAIAIDWLSLAATWSANEGVTAHQELLGRRRGDRAILIFEDVRVSALGDRSPVRVIAVPVQIDGIDSFPVAIVAEVTDR